jgi:hypothetical protein
VDTRRYAGVSEEYFSRYVSTYRGLCSKSWRIYIPLAIGGVAQAIDYASFFDALIGRPLGPVAFLTGLLPLAVYFVITFCRTPPPVTPLTFRRLLLFVMTWYVANTVILLTMASLLTRATGLGARATTALRACMVFGCLAIPTLLRRHNALHRQELTVAAVSGSDRNA